MFITFGSEDNRDSLVTWFEPGRGLHFPDGELLFLVHV